MNEFTATMKNYLKSVQALVIKLMIKPVDFFRTLPKTGGFLDPLIFVLLVAVLGVLLNAIEAFFTRGIGLGMVVIWLLTVPFIMVILSVFFTGVCYAIWALMGSQESFEASYRCVAYTLILFPIIILLSIVPYLGLLGFAWWLYLMVVASQEVHQVAVKPALLAFGAIAVLSGIIYYSSVSANMQSKTHMQELTKELQRMPGTKGMENSDKR